MEFFTSQDIQSFADIISKKKLQGAELKAAGQKLTNGGVFDKTGYWAEQIRQLGYKVDYRYSWQFSGTIRHYSWARVYVSGLEDAGIFFTCGVSGDKGEIFFDIDCQRRDGLTKGQVKLFDSLVIKGDPRYSIRIPKNELNKWDWNTLISKQATFMQASEPLLRTISERLWPFKIGVIPKSARVCWNDNGWTLPSGPVGKSTTTGAAFEKDKGYGYEEWLFRDDRLVDGYHYGFIQAFNKGEHEGKCYDLDLYTMLNVPKSPSKYFWVGRIKELYVLTADEKEQALSLYTKKGWLSEMNDEVKPWSKKGLDFTHIPAGDIFNVKYKVSSDNVSRLDPMLEIEDVNAEVGGNKHYTINDKLQTRVTIATSGGFSFREGHNPMKGGSTFQRNSGGKFVRNLTHKDIQNELYNIFLRKFKNTGFEVGTENNTGLGTFIDLVVKSDNTHTFYEIKTSGNVLSCIREGIGQLLEYSCYHQHQYASKMVVIGLSAPDERLRQYLEHLRTSFKLPLYYQHFDLKTKELSEEI